MTRKCARQHFGKYNHLSILYRWFDLNHFSLADTEILNGSSVISQSLVYSNFTANRRPYFRSKIPQCRSFLNPKFQASSYFLRVSAVVVNQTVSFFCENAQLKLILTSLSFEPPHEKTNILHVRKQRRRSATQ